MAHWPRWVDEPTIDSTAMLSAYMKWAASATESELGATIPYLYTVEHLPVIAEAGYIGGIRMPAKVCDTPDCARCLTGASGYKFRWVDRRWLATYQELKRPGSFSFR